MSGSSLRENNRPAAVDQDPAREVQANRAGQDLALEVAALADQILDLVAVAYPAHVLLDDRPLVEIGGHVVGGGADDLDAAVLGLMVGAGADERRQERMVDVDEGVAVLNANMSKW